MKMHDLAFSSRPLSTTVSELTNSGRDIIFAPYGDFWRQLRKIAITELLSARRVLSFRRVREEEVAAMLRAVAAAADDVIDMRERLSTVVSDVSARVLLGDRCKERDMFLRQLDVGIELAAGFNPADLWPSSWLARELTTSVRRAKRCRDAVFRMLDRIIKEHLERVESGEADKAEDLLTVLLKIQRDGELDMDVVKSMIFDLLSGGSETSATSLEWCMAELIQKPRVMKRVTDEVRRTFAQHGTVPEQDLSELRYLHLVIRETLRLHPPLPLLLPRECQEPRRVLGPRVSRCS
ncbi:hypothetical protein HU200_029287 [Digitaria exilis]|uniref:Cytochrome P450 n=1 Tax=Digitaria exilis TaxID=1010633 RepID=A0A835BTN1_9POAL|nr:hypothetical protein HU200_029287 [Digitaria exilis]